MAILYQGGLALKLQGLILVLQWFLQVDSSAPGSRIKNSQALVTDRTVEPERTDID